MYRALFPKERFPNGHPALATSISNLAALYQLSGEYAKAEPVCQEAVHLQRLLFPKERFPNGHPDLATSINNLASLYQSSGEYAKAKTLNLEALRMRRALFSKKRFPNGHPDLARSINNLANLYESSGEYAKAEPFCQEAVHLHRLLFPKERFPNGHPDLAASIGNLASLYQSSGEYAKAEPLWQEALRMSRLLFPKERFPNGHPALAASINNLALLYGSSGEYAKAEPFCREALQMYRALFPKERFPNGHLRLATSINNLAALYQCKGQFSLAEKIGRDAVTMYRALSDAFLSTAAEAEAMNFLDTLPMTLDASLSVTRHLNPRPDHYEPLWHGRAPLFRLLQRRRLDLAAAHKHDTEALAARLTHARLQLSRALLSPRGASADELARLTAAKETLEKDLAARLGLHSPLGQATTGPTALAEVLPPGGVFVDLLRYTDFESDSDKPGRVVERRTLRYVAFVLSPGKAAVRVELGEATPIERAWTDWQRAIQAGADDRRQASALAQLVWRPLRAYLPTGTKVVWLCPDGALCQVPWAALPGHKPGTVLLEEHALAVVPHGPFLADALRGPAPPAPSKGKILLVGGVDYDGAAAPPTAIAQAGLREPAGVGRKGLAYLPGTLTEIERITTEARVTLQAEPEILRGKEASVATLMGAMSRSRYAHIATHGFFADASLRSVLQVDEQHFRWSGRERSAAGARNPLVLSGLVLAGANRGDAGPDRGILTAEGVVGLNLEGLELAVLSACETGLGEVAGGEGVLGLVRAFHVAGTRDVVASLWRVGDDSTAALMGRFYHRLWSDKQAPLEALRQAQLDVYYHPGRIEEWSKRAFDASEAPLGKPAVAASGRDARARTAQWAAFVLSGAGR
jgi:CHAT domain-containing protein